MILESFVEESLWRKKYTKVDNLLIFLHPFFFVEFCCRVSFFFLRFEGQVLSVCKVLWLQLFLACQKKKKEAGHQCCGYSATLNFCPYVDLVYFFLYFGDRKAIRFQFRVFWFSTHCGGHVCWGYKCQDSLHSLLPGQKSDICGYKAIFGRYAGVVFFLTAVAALRIRV